MSIDEEYQALGVVHGEWCEICDNEPPTSVTKLDCGDTHELCTMCSELGHMEG